MGISRREFLFMGAAAGATVTTAVAVPVVKRTHTEGDDGSVRERLQYGRERVASLSDLSVGEPVTFDYPAAGDSSLLVKLGAPAIGGIGPDNDVVAFSNRCTHMGCAISDFQQDEHVLGPCPCHFTTFDFAHDGQVVMGQATQNLPRVDLEIDGDDIYATSVTRLLYGRADNLIS